LPLALSAIAGIVIGLFQSVLQIQEQSLVLLVKLVIISSVIVVAGEWFLLRTSLFFVSSLSVEKDSKRFNHSRSISQVVDAD